MYKKIFFTLSALITIAFTTNQVLAQTVKQEVDFKCEISSATYKGKIRGYNYDTYIFTAQKGEFLRIKLDTETLYAYLFHDELSDSIDVSTPYSSELNDEGLYELPYSGKYELRVLQTRNDARKGKTRQYTIDISIQPPSLYNIN